MTDDISPGMPSPPWRPTETARLQLAQTQLDSAENLDAIFCQACELCAETLAVARVSIWLFGDQRSAVRCVNLYEAGVQTHSGGMVLHCDDFPTYFAALSARKVLPVENALHDPLTAELVEPYLRPLGITSMLDAPIYFGGAIQGLICHEHTGPVREWTTEERDFAASMADLVAVKMRAAEIHQLQSVMRETEAQLMRLEKSDALARMAGGIAHDFRNLLGVILGNAEMIVATTAPDSALHTFGEQILDATNRGTALVKSLLEFGRNSPARPTVLHPWQRTEAFLPMLQTAVGSTYRLDAAHRVSNERVFMDPNQFDRILLNLVMNARDALPDRGSITIRIDPGQLVDPHFSDYVVIEVSDQGCGMDLDTQTRLFEPYFTTKERGLGLGMAIVQRLVERAGGQIAVDSAPGQGTRIRVYLPRIL